MNNLLNTIKNHKFLSFGSFLIIIFIVIYFINLVSPSSLITKKTVPVIPTESTSPQLAPPNALTKQNLLFNWGDVNIDIPPIVKKISITKPLINEDIINFLSKTLGFSSDDLLKSTKKNNRTWQNSEGSLFTSINQNQIIYSSKGNTPLKTSNITKDEAVDISKSILSNFFGENILQTLDSNSQVRFLQYNPENYNPTAVSDPKTAEYIEVSYKQSLASYPLSSLNGNTNLISVVIDNQKKLYRLEISGGYIEFSSQEEQPLIDLKSLKSTTFENVLKISSLPNVSLESLYLDATDINIKVNQGYFGYFITSTNEIIPVVYISGTVTAKNIPPQSVIYAISVAK